METEKEQIILGSESEWWNFQFFELNDFYYFMRINFSWDPLKELKQYFFINIEWGLGLNGIFKGGANKQNRLKRLTQ